jgi:hypothetical protein
MRGVEIAEKPVLFITSYQTEKARLVYPAGFPICEEQWGGLLPVGADSSAFA